MLYSDSKASLFKKQDITSTLLFTKAYPQVLWNLLDEEAKWITILIEKLLTKWNKASRSTCQSRQARKASRSLNISGSCPQNPTKLPSLHIREAGKLRCFLGRNIKPLIVVFIEYHSIESNEMNKPCFLVFLFLSIAHEGNKYTRSIYKIFEIPSAFCQNISKPEQWFPIVSARNTRQESFLLAFQIARCLSRESKPLVSSNALGNFLQIFESFFFANERFLSLV